MTTLKVVFPDGTSCPVEDAVLRFEAEDGTPDDMAITDMLDGYFAGTELCDAIIDSQDPDSDQDEAIDAVQEAIDYLMACNGYVDDSDDGSDSDADDDSEEELLN